MRRITLVAAAVLTWSCAALGDVVLDWNRVTLDTIRSDRTAPPRAARALAMVHVAIFEAINAINGGFEPYLSADFGVRGNESIEAAVATAARDVLVALYPDQIGAIDEALESSLVAIPEGNARDRGVDLGRRVALALLTARAQDGSDAIAGYTTGLQPGDWQPTPPMFLPGLLPQWPSITPFCLPEVESLRRPGPPALTSSEYTTSFNEVKLLGAKDSAVRTDEETQIAFFWVDGPGTATPPGHWFQIARDVAIQQGNSVEENARLFALLGMAVCDAGICSWDHKYHYGDWRPITGIREADSDGNPATEADPTWEPLIPTPPFPSYTSGHSTFSGAGSKILALFYGADEMAFTTASDDVPGVTRSFTRFSQAGNEAGRSRIYGGIHWEYDNQDGLASGREIALYVFENFLRPIEPDVITLSANDVVMCGPIGLFPLGFLLTALVGMRGCLKGSRH